MFGCSQVTNDLRITSVTVHRRGDPSDQSVWSCLLAFKFHHWFPSLRNEHRNSMLMTCHYPDLSSASDWSCHVRNLLQPIRSTNQIWVVPRHRNGISSLVSQMSFCGETSSGVAKCQLSSQAMYYRKVEELKNRTASKNYNIWHAITWNNCEESPHERCSERLQNGTYQCCL